MFRTGPDYSPGLLVKCSGGGADVPLREGRHETRNSFTRGELEFETKGCAVKDMRGDRMITILRWEGDFTVMNHVGGEAGGEEELSCSRVGGVFGSCHWGNGGDGGEARRARVAGPTTMVSRARNQKRKRVGMGRESKQSR